MLWEDHQLGFLSSLEVRGETFGPRVTTWTQRLPAITETDSAFGVPNEDGGSFDPRLLLATEI